MTLIRNVVTRPHHLQWWQWGQIMGVSFPILFLLLGIHHPLLWALGIHLLMDFTTQSDETAAGKARGDWSVLSYHAFISGGYAGLIVGGLPGLAISAITHFLIDSTNKFGRAGITGAILDQGAHIATLIAIWWML